MKKITQISKNQISIVIDELKTKNDFPIIFCLEGGLGVGKTFLVSSYLRSLGFASNGSPTFNLIHNYKNKDIDISHIDLYRLKDQSISPEDIATFNDALDSDIIFIEWPSISNFYKKYNYYTIKITESAQGRNYELSYNEKR